MRDLWRPGGGRSALTWRLVKVLIDNLPPESATKTSARDALTDEQLAKLLEAEQGPAAPGHGPWSHLEHLSASIVDVLQQIRHVLVVVNGGTSDPPKPLSRPGVGGRRRKISQPGREHLAQMAAAHEQQRKEAGHAQ